MNAAVIAAALGGGGTGCGWHRARCPVHHSRGLTLALRDGAAGLIIKCFRGCTRADVFSELVQLGLLDDAATKRPRGALHPEKLAQIRKTEAANRQLRIANALEIWSETVPAVDTLVETYLWSRLICLSPPPTLRLHRSLWHRESGQRRPAMIALIEHAEFGRTGFHATYLASDGSGKAMLDPVRKSFGAMQGGAVRLAPIGPDGRLIVGEGIETVLSVMLSTGIGAWAALCADNLAKLVLPPAARRIIIAADNDANGIGQRKAQSAALRFRSEGRSVKVCIPPVPGDFNDALLCRIPVIRADHHAAR